MKSFPVLEFAACNWYWRVRLTCSSLRMRSSASTLKRLAASNSEFIWFCRSCWIVTALFKILFSCSTFSFWAESSAADAWAASFSVLFLSISEACCAISCWSSSSLRWKAPLISLCGSRILFDEATFNGGMVDVSKESIRRDCGKTNHWLVWGNSRNWERRRPLVNLSQKQVVSLVTHHWNSARVVPKTSRTQTGTPPTEGENPPQHRSTASSCVLWLESQIRRIHPFRNHRMNRVRWRRSWTMHHESENTRNDASRSDSSGESSGGTRPPYSWRCCRLEWSGGWGMESCCCVGEIVLDLWRKWRLTLSLFDYDLLFIGP